MPWTISTREARVSLREDTQIPHIDLAEPAEHARSHSKKELARLIEERQEKLVEELCGPRYSRGHRYRRGGSYQKRFVTCLGEIRFKVKKIVRRSDGEVSSPILGALDARRRRYSRGVRMRLAEFASKMSYGDASLEFETVTGVHVLKRTIHGFIRELAPILLSACRMAVEAGLVIGDSTKVRARASREMNNVRVLMSGGGRMLVLEVNEEWPRAEAGVLVSDSEPGLVNAVEAGSRQPAAMHSPCREAPPLHPVEGGDEPRREA